MNTDRHTLSLHDTLPIAKAGRAGHITFSTARDPDHETCARLLAGLPAAGADLIELGVPFTDPMADGPSIEAANLRALANGATLRRTLDLVRGFRKADDTTPIRSEEHTSELQSLMRISYAVFCLKKKT